MKRLKSPALHMLAIGGLMFGLAAWRGGADQERPPIVIPAHRAEQVFRTFVTDNFRPPTPEERSAMLDALIDDEVLYRYALDLGMHEHTAARRRLAQIAEFVEANPHAETEAERAEAALELGLHHGDLVVRRILVDSARRLIRAVVLLREPDPGLVAAFLAANAGEFTRPARSRVSHVAVNGFKWPDTEARARELLERIRAESLDFESALALADESLEPLRLPPLTEQALATRFGVDFAAAAIALPEGGWHGPIASRYGHHLVYVHERQEAYLPPLEEIRSDVVERLRQKLADEWLGLRLRELRAEYEIVLPGRTT